MYVYTYIHVGTQESPSAQKCGYDSSIHITLNARDFADPISLYILMVSPHYLL